MPSQSYERLSAGLDEVRALLAANPVPKKGLPRFDVLRAIGRAAVVLATSHLEAYIYGLTEEVSVHFHAVQVEGDRLPVRLRLKHSEKIIESIAETGWDKRQEKLEQAFSEESQMWVKGATITYPIDHEQLLSAMKTPRGKPLIRYFRDWGVRDIFTEITRKATTRQELFLRIDELGEKRNLIAHGDLAAQATAADVRRFLGAVETFCERVDKVMSRKAYEITGVKPWS